MIEAFSQMLWPLMACLVLVGIHAYLGIHVLARKVIFVDLALAQIAGLGAVYGVFIGLSLEANAWAIKGISIFFTLIGAVLFSFTRSKNERVPHEAIIGIFYAAALSMTVIISANLPHGADEVRQMLAGNILWVRKSEVLYTALLYGAVGLVHFIFRKQFFLLSKDLAHEDHGQLNVRFWDFLFYATFGVVVTSSVGIGGVLLVFGYLVIPSVIGVMMAQSNKWRLIIGWSSGAFMSVLGVLVSYFLDLPSGPTIVVLLGVLLVIVVMAQKLSNAASRSQGLFFLSVILIIVIAVSFLPFFTAALGKNQDEIKSQHHLLSHGHSEIGAVKKALLSTDDEENIEALNVVRSNKLIDAMPEVVKFLDAADDKKRELAVRVLASLEDERAKDPLMAAAGVEKDAFIKIEMAEALLTLRDKNGLSILSSIMIHDRSEFARDDARTHLDDRLIDAPKNDQALAKFISDNFQRLRFDEMKKKFYLEK